MRRTGTSKPTIVTALTALAFGALVAAGCAAGTDNNGDDDDDPRPDSSVSIDGPPGSTDARPIDASLPIDGSFPIDASLPIDAAQTGVCTTTAECSSMPGTCCDVLTQTPGMCVLGIEITPGLCFPLGP